MKISVYASSDHIKPADTKGKIAVVVDMLRATTTIITALNNGALNIAPMQHIEQAIAVKRSNKDILLGGERNAEKIQGFDFGNSPLEYSREMVKDKNIILCTTNGSKAIQSASQFKRTIIGALINATAVAKKLSEQEDDVAIICAGTDGKFSIDDIVTAGAIIAKLKNYTLDLELDDLGILCTEIYSSNAENLHTILNGSMHYTRLMRLGFIADINYCLTEDIVDFAPEYADGSITLATALSFAAS